MLFEHEAERSGIRVIYRTVPESDAITEMLLRSILQAMDEWHSLMSRQKGLAGMAENVRKGYRAGGRAPLGYKLESITTGAIRDGQAVKKSKLVPGHDASKVGAYLKARANGISRIVAMRELDRDMEASSLVGLEWNALTYAGHTVWNVHNDRDSGGHYRGGSKRRPRSEWVIQRDTHPALISNEEAEVIISRLESSSVKNNRRGSPSYLLSGLLRTPSGLSWHGDKGGKYYRVKNGRSLPVEQVDRAIMDKVISDLTSPEFVAETLQVTKSLLGQDHSGEIERLQKRNKAIERQISDYLDMARQMETPLPILRKVDELERERLLIAGELTRLEAEDHKSGRGMELNEAGIAKMLANIAEELQDYDRESLKDFLGTMLERVDLDPEAMSCQLHYRISAPRRNKLASPRDRESITLRNSTTCFLKMTKNPQFLQSPATTESQC